jgi:hypothetical protein
MLSSPRALLMCLLLAGSCVRKGFDPGGRFQLQPGETSVGREAVTLLDSRLVEGPFGDGPRPDRPSPLVEGPFSDGPRPDKPSPDAPKSDKPSPDAPKSDKPSPDAPKSDKPSPDAPKSDIPAPDGGTSLLPVWCKRIGGTGNDVAQSVAVDGAGNVYIAGTFEASVDFGGGAVTSAGGTDVYLASYTPAGAYRWARAFGSSSADGVGGVGVDSAGNVYMAGTLKGGADYGGGALNWSGSSDLFVVSYTGAGAPRWGKAYGDGGYQATTGASVDATGNVYLSGTYDGKIMFGTGTSLTAQQGFDVFAASLTNLGGARWSASWNFGTDVWYDYGNAITHDTLGNAYVSFRDNYGPGYHLASRDASGASRWLKSLSFTLTGLASGANALYGVGGVSVVKHDGASGANVWSKPFAGAGWGGVAVDAAGEVHLVGKFTGTADFGGGAMTSAGGADWVVAKLSGAAGAHLFSGRLGGTGNDTGLGLALDGSGNRYITGSFESSMTCAGAALTSAGLTDALLVKLPL